MRPTPPAMALANPAMAIEAGAAQSQADRQSAPAIEPEPQHVGDAARAQCRPAERHQQIGGKKLPQRVDHREQGGGGGETGDAGQNESSGSESADRFADENHQ